MRNNSDVRKAERKSRLAFRLIEINESGLSVAEREAKRGYPARAIAEAKAAATPKERKAKVKKLVAATNPHK